MVQTEDKIILPSIKFNSSTFESYLRETIVKKDDLWLGVFLSILFKSNITSPEIPDGEKSLVLLVFFSHVLS